MRELATTGELGSVTLDDVLLKVQGNSCTLFYGAGVSVGCGGPDGGHLFGSVKRRFPGGKSSTFLDYMSEVIGFDDSKRREVEKTISQELLRVSPHDEQKYLFSLPWRAVVTTNYDNLPEIVQTTLDSSRTIIPVIDPSTDLPIEYSKNQLLYCFKIMGDASRSSPRPGCMVLSNEDLSFAAPARNSFFDALHNLAITGNIVYIGYSFEDGVVLRILYEVKRVLGDMPWRGFAIIPSRPSPATLEKMRILGISWVPGTLEEFIKKAGNVFGREPVSCPLTIPNLSVLGVPVKVDRATLTNIAGKFSILDNKAIEPASEQPRSFFEGRDHSFYPYKMQWDFQRKTNLKWTARSLTPPMPLSFGDLKNRPRKTNSSDDVIVALSGSAGSGKSVVANRLAFEWYQNGDPVIFISPNTLILDTKALEGLLDEIWNKYLAEASKAGQTNPPPIRFLFVADDCADILDQLIDLKNRLIAIGKPADIVLSARASDIGESSLKDAHIDAMYSLDDTVLPEEWGAFVRHFEKWKVIKSPDVVEANLGNEEINKSFFALVYTTVRGAKISIDILVSEEFESLDAQDRKLYETVALIQSQLLMPWTNLALKASGMRMEQLEANMRTRLGGVLMFNYGENVLSAPNRIIADIIKRTAFKTNDSLCSALQKIVTSVSANALEETTLLHKLLTDKETFNRVSRGFGYDQKIRLFEAAIKIIPSRPLYVHMARQQIDSEDFDGAKLSLKLAKEAHRSDFHETDQHVYDCEGRLEYGLAIQAHEKHHDVESAREHATRAERHFQDAMISPKRTPHPYHGLGLVYTLQAQLAVSPPERWAFMLLAIGELMYAEDFLGEWANRDITRLKIEVLSKLDYENLDDAKIQQIKDKLGLGNGYAFLAERALRDGNEEQALRDVETGLAFERSSLWLIRMHVKLAKKVHPDDLEELKRALDDYKRLSPARFDVSLTFELAMERYKSKDYFTSTRLFNDLEERAKHHPNFSTPLKKIGGGRRDGQLSFRGRSWNHHLAPSMGWLNRPNSLGAFLFPDGNWRL